MTTHKKYKVISVCLAKGDEIAIDNTLAGAGRWRVYFNRRGTLLEAWSVDKGHGKPRRHFRRVSTLGVTVTYVNSGKEPDWRNPVAWTEVKGYLEVIRTPHGFEARIRP